MTDDIFTTTNILLPKHELLNTWSVIACDQFSSEPDYWERVKENARGKPSALNMILPEVYLAQSDERETLAKIAQSMDCYINSGVFSEITDSFIYVERTLTGGPVRRGLVGAVDLEEYDFTGKPAAVLASEGTIPGRLPARVNIRRASKLELSHIMAFINDRDKTVIEPLADRTAQFPILYDFDLMEDGGHIRGFRITGENAADVKSAINSLRKDDGALIIIGDGNHSLAAAKVYWEEIKQGLSADERERHPARFSLLEINNVFDPAVCFEAIHRVVFNTDPQKLLGRLEASLPGGADYTVDWVCGEKRGTLGFTAPCIGDFQAMLQEALDDGVSKTGGVIDYIHGGDTVRELSHTGGRLGLILPAIEKSDFFETVITRGTFPKKSFSVGRARDKRYYLECRKIKYY